MGFFKEMKEDLSQAVNELLPEEISDDDVVVNTLDEPKDVISEEEETSPEEEEPPEEELPEEDTLEDGNVDQDILDAILVPDKSEGEPLEDLGEKEEPEKSPANTDTSNEITIITKGTVINGSICADGSLEVMGTIKGDVECQGKLSILGNISGNSIAAEIYVGTKRLEGSINSEGSVKIGLGSVVLGDVTGTSAVIAGAVKGEIDVNGPIIIDSSAVIKGNIKAQSIQINNGAVIEGYCSLAYASIDIDNIFE